MHNVAIESYGEYSSENYGAHALRVTVGSLSLWFSYKTPVAFACPGRARTVCENCWGPTTGKHLNWIDGGEPHMKKARLPREQFDAALTEAVASFAPGVVSVG